MCVRQWCFSVCVLKRDSEVVCCLLCLSLVIDARNQFLCLWSWFT